MSRVITICWTKIHFKVTLLQNDIIRKLTQLSMQFELQIISIKLDKVLELPQTLVEQVSRVTLGVGSGKFFGLAEALKIFSFVRSTACVAHETIKITRILMPFSSFNNFCHLLESVHEYDEEMR